MTQTLDVYRDWLKISDATRPLNHYQLLRLKAFEDNTAKVREHYRAMNAHVRKYAAGEFAAQSQELLNELARAMLCLTDSARKGEYDASLGRKDGKAGKARSFEQILLAGKVVDQAALEKARNFARAINVEVRDALVQQRLAKADAVLPAYAESIGLPYLDLTDIPLDQNLISRVPPMMARQHSCIPVMVDNNQVLMASPTLLDPNVEEELRLRFGMPVRLVLCTPGNISDAITKYVPKDASVVETAPLPQATQQGGAAQQAAPAAAPVKAKRVGPLNDAEKKERRDYALVGFNITVMVLMGILWQYLGRGFFSSALIALPVAAAAAGIVWKVKSR
jgi:hypothetical protein